jgi:dihydrofolate reductase
VGKLRFGMGLITLDGYVKDRRGSFDFGHVSEELHRHAQEEEEHTGLAIYGRHMFETMAVWDRMFEDRSAGQFERDFSEIWRSQEKIVVSRSLASVTTTNTRLVRELTAEDIHKLKAETQKDISVSGPTLAATYLKQGLVDEVTFYYAPVVVGGGLPMFPDVSAMLKFELIEERRLENGAIFVRYRVLN